MGRLTEEDKKYIKENPQLQNKELAEILHHDRHTIGNYKKKLGIAFTQTHNFSQYDEYIKENYYKRTAKSLAEEIGCSKEYVKKIWVENGLRGKTPLTYYCDYNYFETIDCENKAYIIGFLASDGNLYKRDNHEGQIQITLHKNDKEILERILQIMHSNHPIKIGNTKPTACITFVSDKMYNDLLKIGLTPNKTLNLHIQEIFNNIPKQFWGDFIRGYLDGDGSIHFNSRPSDCTIQIALPEYSSYEFIKRINELGNIQLHFSLDKRAKYTIPFGALVANNTTEKYVFLKLLYSNEPELFLTRKKQAAEKIMLMIEENKTNRSENKTAVSKWGEVLENLKWQSAAEP